MEGVAASVPSFDGTAPKVGGVVPRIAAAPQRMLQAKGVRGKVDHRMDLIGEEAMAHRFVVTGVPIPVCEVRFPGASAIPEVELQERSEEIIGRDYSGRSAPIFAQQVLLPLYRERGYLGARIGPEQASLSRETACLGGVSLIWPVAEGRAYRWGGAEWAGGRRFTANQMDEALGMAIGEIAVGSRIEAGLAALRERYLNLGYADIALTTDAALDDAGGRVVYRISIEGQAPGIARYTSSTLRIDISETRDPEARVIAIDLVFR